MAAGSDVRYSTAVKYSQAVMKTVREAVASGELADIFRDLPQKYDEPLSGIPRSPAAPAIVK